MLNVLKAWRQSRSNHRHSARTLTRFRPMVESLEGREVPSANQLTPAFAPALAAPLAHQALSLLPIQINNVIVSNGSLLANASLGSTNFQIPLTLTASQTGSTPILDLDLAPIHLDLLGLKVDTSAICLDITAQSGPGNLLGNLLTDVANLLNQGIPLNQVLAGLSSTQLNTLNTGLTSLLNGALSTLTSTSTAASSGGTSVSSTSTTRILHLSVGPLDLNLLGLDVTLDNCNNGPVTVDITAQSGPGNLLGNLLGGLAHLLDSNAANTALVSLLNRVANEISVLI
ncbi:MAG: hypothetical protein ACJ8FY_21895 [Gemmataceae bacterium]